MIAAVPGFRDSFSRRKPGGVVRPRPQAQLSGRFPASEDPFSIGEVQKNVFFLLDELRKIEAKV